MKILLIIIAVLLAVLIIIALVSIWKIRRAKNKILKQASEILVDGGLAATKIIAEKFKEEKENEKSTITISGN
jgi:predicted small integral membrane protein